MTGPLKRLSAKLFPDPLSVSGKKEEKSARSRRSSSERNSFSERGSFSERKSSSDTVTIENLLDESLTHKDLLAKSTHRVQLTIHGTSVSQAFHALWSGTEKSRTNILGLGVLEKLRQNELGRPRKWLSFLQDLYSVYDGLERMVQEHPQNFPLTSPLFDRLRRSPTLLSDIRSFGRGEFFPPGKGAKWCATHLEKVSEARPELLELHLFVFYYFHLFHGEETKLWVEKAKNQWDFCSNVETSVYDFEDRSSLCSNFISAFNQWLVKTALELYDQEEVLLEFKNAYILFAHLLEVNGEVKKGSSIALDIVLADLEETPTENDTQ